MSYHYKQQIKGAKTTKSQRHWTQILNIIKFSALVSYGYKYSPASGRFYSAFGTGEFIKRRRVKFK